MSAPERNPRPTSGSEATTDPAPPLTATGRGEPPLTATGRGEPPLTATGRVILGMLALGKRSGYDIKQFVDQSTRHFWAASYGQIYPELRHLEEHGLVRGRPEPSGGRARTVFELTDAGEAALADWLRSDLEPLYELRDEGMLKLFFSDVAGPQWRIANLRAMRERHERKLAQLRAIEPAARSGRAGPYLTLELGIGMSQRFIEWCETTERRLAETETETETEKEKEKE